MGFFKWLFGNNDSGCYEGPVQSRDPNAEGYVNGNSSGGSYESYCPPGICTPSRTGTQTRRQEQRQEAPQIPQVHHRGISVEEQQARHLLEKYNYDVKAIAKEIHPDRVSSDKPELRQLANNVMAEVNRIASEEPRGGGFWKLR